MATAAAGRIGTAPATRAQTKAVRAWLVVCAAMIFVMVALGGATRLTGSGLSMVNWHPVAGVLPPLTDHDWQATFEAYKATPQYRRVNFWMTLSDFKGIFWLEYVHRLWGRTIGAVFLLPFLWFLLRGRIDGPLGWRLAAVFALGGAQGLLGWYMVRSGLVDRPEVSHYRLAAHLLLAVALYGTLVWTALGLGTARRRPDAVPLGRHVAVVLGLVVLTMTWGALVAGLGAGHVAQTFPLMEGRIVPPEALALSPWPLNLVANPLTVQFIHRCLAITVVAAVLWLWWRGRARPGPWLHLLAAMALVQAGLGIATLLADVPVALAVLHQSGALVLFTLVICALDAAGRAYGAQPSLRSSE